MSVLVASKVCKAKDKSKCRFHGKPDTAGGPNDLQHKLDNFFGKNSTVLRNISIHELTSNALSSSLNWDGSKPKWWKKYVNELREDSSLSTTAELVDVVDSPVGPLAVVWQHESQQVNDRGMSLSSGYGVKICYYKSMATGENLGYIKMAYMDEDTLKRSFGDDEFASFRFASRYSGDNYFPFEENDDDSYGERNLEGEALRVKRREVWLGVVKDLRKDVLDSDGKVVPYYSLSKENVPDDVQVEEDLKEFREHYQKEMDAKLNFFSAPYVDFSRVETPLRGKGYGTALYVYTARMLGKENKILRGSSIQSMEAQKLWINFGKRFPGNVSTLTREYNGREITDPVLDFRG